MGGERKQSEEAVVNAIEREGGLNLASKWNGFDIEKK